MHAYLPVYLGACVSSSMRWLALYTYSTVQEGLSRLIDRWMDDKIRYYRPFAMIVDIADAHRRSVLYG